MSALEAPIVLAHNLYIVYSENPHRDSGNVYLINGKIPTLIDCGSHRAIPQLLANLARVGVSPGDIVQIIATHGDYDHIQGFHDLRVNHPDLRLYIHPLDWPCVQGSDPYRNASYLYSYPFVPIVAEQCLPIVDGQVIRAGDTELTVYHTPGHTEGSVSLLGDFDGRKVLFAGDTIGGAMRGLEGADLEIWARAAATWKQSLDRLLELDFDWVLNGHEPARSLPITRKQFARSVMTFGKMMSPWFFHRAEEDAEPGEARLSRTG